MSNTKGDIKALVSGIKAAFAAFAGSKEQKFGSSELADKSGTLQWEGDAPNVGMTIMVVPADGSEPIPAPDGEYVLPETGDTLKVEAGVIAAVVPAQATETNPAANEGMSANPAGTPAPTAKEIVERVEKVSKFSDEEIETRFKALEENLKTVTEYNATLKAESDELKQKFAAFGKQVADTLEAYGEQPQTTTTTTQNFRNESTPAKEDLREKLTFHC